MAAIFARSVSMTGSKGVLLAFFPVKFIKLEIAIMLLGISLMLFSAFCFSRKLTDLILFPE